MDWQTPLTILIVLIAIADIGRRLWINLSGRSKAGCGSSCSGCPSHSASELNLMQLGPGIVHSENESRK